MSEQKRLASNKRKKMEEACCRDCARANFFDLECKHHIPEEQWGRKCKDYKKEIRRESTGVPPSYSPGAFDWHQSYGNPSPGAGGRSDPWA